MNDAQHMNPLGNTVRLQQNEIVRLTQEIERLRSAIRTHRDQRGDDRCWMDDEVLYQTLPEGYMPPRRDTEVELSRCRQFIRNRKNPRTEYVSPQRRIEELEKAAGEFYSCACIVTNDEEATETDHFNFCQARRVLHDVLEKKETHEP